MFIHKISKGFIFFGDATQSISLEEIAHHVYSQNMQDMRKTIGAEQVVFLQQEHGKKGYIIEKNDAQDYLFQPTGDYLATQRKQCAIGVVTADCLPIIFYDALTGSIAIIHAGWKGLVTGVFQTAFFDFIQTYGIIVDNLEIYVGPSARPCCYEVQQDFIQSFLEYQDYFDLFFIQKDGKYYFDSQKFVTVLARNLGIDEQKIYTRYNVCTICDISFCSYRREKEKARRQISMVCLH